MLAGKLLSWSVEAQLLQRCELVNAHRKAAGLECPEAQPLDCRELGNKHGQAVEMGAVETQLLQRLGLANSLRQLLGWVPLRLKFCNAVSWPVLSGRLLSCFELAGTDQTSSDRRLNVPVAKALISAM